jgi:hypothetical protein
MLTAKCVPVWKDIHYGVPQPRFIRPLVRIDGMAQDMPQGYHIDPCFLPPTILQLDECELLLRVNDALLDLRPLLPCFKVAAGVGAPAGEPSQGYLPFYLDKAAKKLWVYAGGEWTQI